MSVLPAGTRAPSFRLARRDGSSSWAQAAFAEKLAVSSEQFSDFEPKGATCGAFGVLHEGGFTQRALVICGPDGVVGWSYEAASRAKLPGRELLQEGIATAFA